LRTPILFPGAAVRPYGGDFDAIADAVEAATGPGQLERVVIDRGEMTFVVPREHLAEVAQALRDDPALRFELCLSVSGVHFPADPGRSFTSSIT
jgi:NADH-quinone oxidoreductase subunit C